MKTLRMILCLMLAAALLSGAALAETYTDDWGNGITLNFELDDSLLQPLDIFDASYRLDFNSTDEARDQAKALLQTAMEMTFKEEIPEIFETVGTASGVVQLNAEREDDTSNERAHRDRYSISYCDILQSNQYLSMERDLDETLSALYGDQDSFSYPAARDDFYVEHDFMTHDEADAKARAFMTAMRGEDSPFDVVLRDWYGITHEQFSDYFDWKLQHNDFKSAQTLNYFTGDDWTEKYDAYYLLYSYTYKGYPVCDNARTSYSDTNSALHYSGSSSDCLINRDGFVYANEYMLFDCDYTPYKDTPALTLYEALDVLKEYLGTLNGLNPIAINRVYVEYAAHMQSDDPACKYTYEPIWNFVADMTTDSGVLEEYIVYRVNGHTGEIMTNGYGIIQ